MINLGRRCKEWPDDASPLGKRIGTTKIDGVVLECLPENHQRITLRGFDTLVDLVAAEALGGADHVFHASLDGGVKLGLLDGQDVYISELEDHEVILWA